MTNDELLARLHKLIEERDEEAAIRSKLTTLLADDAVALNGPEPPLKRWSYPDLPEKALAAGIETAVMRVRVEAAERESLEQARLLGMSGSREAALRAKLKMAERQCTALRALLTEAQWYVWYVADTADTFTNRTGARKLHSRINAALAPERGKE